MKTRIYIDGYNLYYGALKKTQYKWLDPVKLIRYVITTSVPAYLIPKNADSIVTKYFRSPVDPHISFSATAERDQKAYLSALHATHPEETFSIISGTHTVAPTRLRRVDKQRPKTLHKDCEIVDVWRIEEKQTDVNLAVEAMKDAYSDLSEQHLVFVTNDTDFLRLFETLNTLPHITIGIVAPGREQNRRVAKGLENSAVWLRNYLTSEELQNAQLPYCIRNAVRTTETRLPIRKPIEWFGEKELAVQIFDQLFRAMGKRNKVYRWLEQNPVTTSIDGLEDLPRPAMQCLDDQAAAGLVLRHVEAYINHIDG